MVTLLKARAPGSYFWNLLCNVRQTPLHSHSLHLPSTYVSSCTCFSSLSLFAIHFLFIFFHFFALSCSGLHWFYCCSFPFAVGSTLFYVDGTNSPGQISQVKNSCKYNINHSLLVYSRSRCVTVGLISLASWYLSSKWFFKGFLKFLG